MRRYTTRLRLRSGRIYAVPILALLSGWLFLDSGNARAHEENHHKQATQSSSAAGRASTEIKLLDLELIDKTGQSVRFKSEAVGERIVVMNFVYTSCTTICPVTSAIFGQVQARLGEHLGKDVFLVSVTVDPVTDRPARLKTYAQKHGARAGWIWLTGNKFSVDKVLDGLGAYTASYQDHPAMILVGDGRTGQWTRFFGFPSPDQIMTKVDALLAARARTVSAARQ